MKQSDIKKLEKVAELYKRIEELLDKVVDSVESQPREYFFRTEQTVFQIIRDMYKDAIQERKYIEGKIKAFQELENAEGVAS